MANIKKLNEWLEAKGRFHLSDMHIQMAQELGMNPKKLGKLANHKQESWKAPLPEFIERCYFKSFKKDSPDAILKLQPMTKKPTHNSPGKADENKEHNDTTIPRLANDR